VRYENNRHYRWLLLAVLTAFTLSGCFLTESNSSNDDEESSELDIRFDISGVDYAAITVDETGLDAGARLLASQCAQCHGTYGVAVRDWPDLWGSGRHTGSWMNDYQDADLYSDNMMHLHALAYTSDEVSLLRSYYDVVDYTGE